MEYPSCGLGRHQTTHSAPLQCSCCCPSFKCYLWVLSCVISCLSAQQPASRKQQHTSTQKQSWKTGLARDHPPSAHCAERAGTT